MKSKMSIEFAAELGHLQANSLKFRVGIGVARQVSKIFDVLFQTVNFALPASRRWNFAVGLHYMTRLMAPSPQSSRAAAKSS